MVIAWLYNIINKNLHDPMAYAETANEIWRDLRERLHGVGRKDNRLLPEKWISRLPWKEQHSFKLTTSRLKPKNHLRCTDCQKIRYDRSECFELIEYPPNWQNR